MRMATTIVELEEFQPDNKSFSSYVDGVQLFFTANDIAYNKKVVVLLPRTPKDSFFDQLDSTIR